MQILCHLGLPRWLSGKESTCQCRRHRRHGFDPWVGKIAWRRKWQPTPVFWLGESHGQRSLGGYLPWGHTESDMSAATECACTHACHSPSNLSVDMRLIQFRSRESLKRRTEVQQIKSLEVTLCANK